MDSIESLWKIEINNSVMELLPGDQIEVAEGRPELFSSSEGFKVEEIMEEDVKENMTGVKRRLSESESLNSSMIDQSKIVIVSEDQSFSLSSRSSAPNLHDDPGPYNFSVSFALLNENKKKHWAYSHRLKKLYIDMDYWLQVEFQAPAGLYIRALPVFSQPSEIHKPVVRCPNHSSPSDRTNQNFPHPDHLVRVAGEDAVYQEDPDTGRLSVLFPVPALAPGAETVSRQVKFMCLGSDLGGICRRPVQLVFTLEDSAGTVLGRRVFHLRLCSCPRRDLRNDEDRLLRQEEAQVKLENSSPDKAAVRVRDFKYLLVPVSLEDYESVDSLVQQLTENREIQNKPHKSHYEVIQAVKKERIKLLIEHNPGLENLLAEKKMKIIRK